MDNLYKGFNKIQELYNTFECQYDILQDHNTHRRVASNAFDNVLDWKKNIKQRLHDFPLVNKLQNKKTKVTIDTWESICDSMESIIKDGQMACKRRWFAAETFLDFLELPYLDPIHQELPPKLKLEEIERSFVASKDQILEKPNLLCKKSRDGLRHPIFR